MWSIMETRRYGMLPADVYRLTGVAEPHISPDGTRVAYQVGVTGKVSFDQDF